jgi:hypothetical protein
MIDRGHTTYFEVHTTSLAGCWDNFEVVECIGSNIASSGGNT